VSALRIVERYIGSELRTCNPKLQWIKPSFLNLFMKKLTRLRVIPTNSARSRLRPCCTSSVISFEVSVLLGSDLFGPVGPAYGNRRNNVLLVSLTSFVDGPGVNGEIPWEPCSAFCVPGCT